VDELGTWLATGYGPAYRTAYLILRDRALAEEAVQEAFLRAWRFRAALPDGDGMRPWLYRVVVNSCCSKLRQESMHRTRDDAAARREAASRAPATPEDEVARAELAEAVTAALAALPEHLRIPVVLRYYAGLPEREIAVAIRRRPGTVKSRLHEARRRLAADPRLSAHATEEAR
jgi:RNA polymerase sigma-70 factor (ECF subfamily)